MSKSFDIKIIQNSIKIWGYDTWELGVLLGEQTAVAWKGRGGVKIG
jgi:hypothetical protein